MVHFSILFFGYYYTVGDLLSAPGVSWGSGDAPIPEHSPNVSQSPIESFVNVPHTPSFQ